MATALKRVMISIPPDLEKELDAVKNEQFYDCTYPEVYRYILALGLKAASAQEKAARENRSERAQ